MRQSSFIAVVVIVVVLLAGAAAVYAYDSARADRIASGMSVGGVDLGGMTTAEAREVVEDRIARPLRRPVRVRYKGRTFRLSPRAARLRADVAGMVRQAVAVSREGNLVTRTVRDVSGAGADAELKARVSYSRSAVARLVRRVKQTFDRSARPASVAWAGTGLSVTPPRRGIHIAAPRLRRQVVAELRRPGNRVVRPRPRVTRTSVSRADLRRRYPYAITIDRTGYQLRLYRRLKLVRSYTIAVGQAGLETPAGMHRIQDKAVDPAWHVPKRKWAGRLAGKVIPGGRADNPLKARWMGIADGAGIHGTDDVGSLGTSASHGCIRMSIPEVKELYDRVPVGAPVYIA
jgi:lipoprotein-anchoring transpeptidase ErfK/SrfK